MSDTVIKVENLSKQYRLGVVGTGTLSHDLNRFWAKLRGKKDPYLMVGDTNDRTVRGNSDLVWALKNINFEVKKGEVLGIIGKNGAGKSTLLKILSQVTSPSAGSVKMKGRVGSLLEVGTGFHPELTGRENIYINGAILGMRKWEIDKKLDEIVDFAGVEKYLDTPVKRYSSGMKVRLGFAVAAHLEPEILIVDEVLAVGDAEFQSKCIGKMKDISNLEGKTVLVVSHNMATIRNLCNRVCVIDKGVSIKNTSPLDAVSFYLGAGESKQISYCSSGGKGDLRKGFISKVEITDRLKVAKEGFDVSENIIVEVGCSVTESIGYSFLGLTVSDCLGHVIFMTTNEDIEKSALRFTGSESRYVVEIPSHFLKPGQYFLDVTMYERGEGNIDKVSNHLSFNVVDLTTRRGSFNLYRNRSIVAPLLRWRELK